MFSVILSIAAQATDIESIINVITAITPNHRYNHGHNCPIGYAGTRDAFSIHRNFVREHRTPLSISCGLQVAVQILTSRKLERGPPPGTARCPITLTRRPSATEPAARPLSGCLAVAAHDRIAQLALPPLPLTGACPLVLDAAFEVVVGDRVDRHLGRPRPGGRLCGGCGCRDDQGEKENGAKHQGTFGRSESAAGFGMRVAASVCPSALSQERSNSTSRAHPYIGRPQAGAGATSRDDTSRWRVSGIRSVNHRNAAPATPAKNRKAAE